MNEPVSTAPVAANAYVVHMVAIHDATVAIIMSFFAPLLPLESHLCFVVFAADTAVSFVLFIGKKLLQIRSVFQLRLILFFCSGSSLSASSVIFFCRSI